MVGWSYCPASTTPNALDIVWCRFPESSELKPGPKPRPALVKRVLKDPKTGTYAVEVIFGTGTLKPGLQNQLVVSHYRDLEEGGLSKATRFDLELTKKLPWAKEFFVEIHPGDGPIIGRLSAVCRLDLLEIRAKMQKEKLAAEAKAKAAAAAEAPVVVKPAQQQAPAPAMAASPATAPAAVSEPPLPGSSKPSTS